MRELAIIAMVLIGCYGFWSMYRATWPNERIIDSLDDLTPEEREAIFQKWDAIGIIKAEDNDDA